MRTRRALASEIEALRNLKEKRDRATSVRFRGLILSKKDALEYQEKFCSGCGKEKHKPRLWFGEVFCGECVERFKAGA